MKIKAKFIGENGSLGYKRGKEYYLSLSSYRYGLFGYREGIQIELFYYKEMLNGVGICPYSSLESFLSNWTNIRLLTSSR